MGGDFGQTTRGTVRLQEDYTKTKMHFFFEGGVKQ